MSPALGYVGQGVTYAIFAAVIGYFASLPVYTHFPPDQGLIRLSFTHGAQRAGECRRRSAEEIAKLPPNMRRPLDCPRGRLPIEVELMLDGKLVLRDSLRPTGLSGDGPAHVHRGFPVAPGPHKITVRMRDSARSEGFDHERTADIVVAARQNFVIDFKSASEGFVFR